jgi:site-specific recombinase
MGEVGERLALRLLPATPDTDDGAALFQLLFRDDADAGWLHAIDPTRWAAWPRCCRPRVAAVARPTTGARLCCRPPPG